MNNNKERSFIEKKFPFYVNIKETHYELQRSRRFGGFLDHSQRGF
jgi:hypothetical protein